MAKNKVEQVVEEGISYTEAEIARALEIVGDLTRKAKIEEEEKLALAQQDAIVKYEIVKTKVKKFMKEGFNHPGWIARELHLSIPYVESVIRVIARDIDIEKARETLKIPGLPV